MSLSDTLNPGKLAALQNIASALQTIGQRIGSQSLQPSLLVSSAGPLVGYLTVTTSSGTTVKVPVYGI